VIVVPVADLPYGGTVYFVIRGIESLDQTVAELEQLLQDPRPMFREICNVLRRSFATNFRMGGRPRWQPLKSGTLAAKRHDSNVVYNSRRSRGRIRRLEQVRAEGNPQVARSYRNILIASGSYRDSWVNKADRDHVEKVSRERMEIGSKHRLVQFHEYGTGRYGRSGQSFMIRPRRAKALRFIGPNGVRFAQVVENPGVPARPVAIIQPEDQAAIEAINERFLGGEFGRG
jgi:phage gpG-like protein